MNKIIILILLVVIYKNTYSQRFLIFEDENYKEEAQSCGSNCRYDYFFCKKTETTFKVADVLAIDTINYYVVCPYNNNLTIYSFSGELLKTIDIDVEHDIFAWYVWDKIYFENGYLFIYWNEFMTDKRYKQNSLYKYKPH